MKRLLALALVAVAVAGCGGKPMTEGRVVAKNYEPPRTYTQLILMVTGERCSTSGKSTICTPILTPIPWVMYDDADWRLTLEVTKENGKVHRGKVRVTEAVYDATKVGAWWAKSDGALATGKDTQKVKRAS